MEHSSAKEEAKRKHVTTACVACRESKVKCNGATPACSSCLSKGKECRYQAREDKRRLSLRVAIELLSSRVQQLSHFISAHGLDIPSMPWEEEKTLSAPVPLDFPSSVLTPGQQQASSDVVASCPSLELDDGISPSESIDDLADQLSDRVGTLYIRSGGHIRFYGSTSNFNLLETQPAEVSMNVHRTVRNDGTEQLDRLGINKKVPPEIETHLMNLYFTWQDPSFHVVDRIMFEDAKEAWHSMTEDTAYYSEALRNAICALGAAFDARYHPSFVTFPRSLADFFADRAKALLEIELDSPCVATIQALVLLSAHDIGCGRDARGWLFSGMATRLSFNLALHQDLSPYVGKGVVTATEADLRRTVFWAAFMVDHVWSFYLGQPFRMSMKGVSLDKPGFRSPSKLPGHWTPYTSPNATQSFTPIVDCIEEVCRHQVLLFETMAQLSDTLYSSMTSSRIALQEVNAEIVRKLLDWKENLPAELCVEIDNPEVTYLPHVILLHMQYYQSLIYAHRPWMSKSYIQPNPPRGPGASHARKMCMDSASTIAQLLRLYEERYTLRRINIQAVAITFSAALLLVFATVAHYQRDREDEILADLSVCFRALDELAPSWDTAKRARDFLTRLQRHWQRQAKISSSSPLAGARGHHAGSVELGFPTSRKRPYTSIRLNEGSPPIPHRGEVLSSLETEHPRDAIGFGMDLDFDWMLRTSLEGMPGNWGDVFPVPPGTNILT
ncbi:Fungal specific transcription factor [Pleurostoma richardsiae]|uniref:Fungal specific transcription factor n=1 Tax=Pleurostoma richardsiae TaxID=41990 RepID=A0AA38RYJ2_9PEZI|nr:Fungal specific transcription factor [Pleurostoma richardsiae]